MPAVETPFYLTAEHGLSDKTAGKEASIAYEYDPDDPVPTIGGRNLFLASGPKDQRANESRKDVLVFTTPPLEEDLEVTGKVLMKLYLASKVSEIDIVAHVTDVYPDGKSVLLVEGLSRVEAEGLQKGKPQEVEVDLLATSFVFAKGHSIRISIAGSNYPRFEKNLHKVKAESNDCLILVGKKNPSRLLLPIVRKGTSWLAGVKPSISP